MKHFMEDQYTEERLEKVIQWHREHWEKSQLQSSKIIDEQRR